MAGEEVRHVVLQAMAPHGAVRCTMQSTAMAQGDNISCRYSMN